MSNNLSAVTNILAGAAKAYHALTGRKRRQTTPIDTRAEDGLFQPLDRDQMISNARSLRRNSPVAAWMVRKHLDYVAAFSFQCRSKSEELNNLVEALMTWWMRPLNCDASGRFGFLRMVRMIEGLAFLEGDCFVMKISDGTIQIIEADRVRTPNDLKKYNTEHGTDYKVEDFVHGVQVDDAGRAISYALCERTGAQGSGGFALKEVVDARNVFHHAYIDRYDQIRGVSPLSSAMNTFVDLYEAQDYALNKMKAASLFLAKYRRAAVAGDADATDNGTDTAGSYNVDLNEGPQFAELDPEDDLEFLESKTPSVEFQQFGNTVTANAIKGAADLPYSFFDESHTNYSGARQALLMYEQSAEHKRQNLIALLNGLTVWRLKLFIADGHLTLPNHDDGTPFGMDDISFEWIAAPLPWIDPLKEVSANAMAMENLLTSPQRLAKESGQDWNTIIQEIADAKKKCEELGIPFPVGGNAKVVSNLIEQQTQEEQTVKSNGGKNDKRAA